MYFFHVLLCLVSFYVFPIFGLHKAECLQKDLQRITKYDFKMFGTKIDINYALSNNRVNQLSSNFNMSLDADVFFTANILPKTSSESVKVDVHLSPKRVTVYKGYETVNDEKRSFCKLTVWEDEDVSHLSEFKSEILDLAEDCLRWHICEELNSETQNVPVQQNPEHDMAVKKPDCACAETKINTDMIYNPQATINAMTDFGVALIINRFVLSADGILEVPPIFTNFSTGSSFWKTTGDINTSKGRLEGLENLNRKSDIIIKNEKHRFFVNTAFELLNSKLTFDYYNLRYGTIKVDGDLTVLIDEILLNAGVELDYNSSFCQMRLINFGVHMGNFEVKLTGLGFLNGPVSKAISWVIKHKLHNDLKNIINHAFAKVNCEKFRP